MSQESDALDRRALLRLGGAATVAAALTAHPAGPARAATGASAPALAPPGGPAAPRAALALPTDGPRWVVRPFPLDRVRLTGRTVFTEKRDRVLRLAAAYPADRVLHNFRVTAGRPLPPGSTPPGGWDDATGNLRGHYSGHLLTLLAQAYAGTGETRYRDKLALIVAELAACQAALAASGRYSHPGFLAAYPETQFVQLESFATYPTVWAPWYTCHKIMRGLLDAYLLTGNQQALQVVSRMGDWAHSRLSRLPRATLNRMWAIYIAGEYGAMNEVLVDLHAITGQQRYLDTARCFDNRQSLFDACLTDRDLLTGLHANTHVPQFLGYLRVFDQSGDPTYATVARNFWRMVVPHRMYAHGGIGGTWPQAPGLPGNTNPELLQPRGNIAGSIAGNGAETCTSHNLLKMARILFFQQPDPALLDYYERTLVNHILGSRRDTESTTSPEVTYFLPLTPGSTRAFGNVGTCCGGTGLENHTKYQDSVYFRAADDSALYVNLFVGSVLQWPERGLTLTQVTDFPREQAATLTLTLTGPTTLDLLLRVPSWAPRCRVRVNGQEWPETPRPGSYLRLRRTWRSGDTVGIELPFRLRVERAPDDPQVQTVFHGPVVLAALSADRGYRQFSFYRHVRLDGEIAPAFTPAAGGTFTSNGHTLRPLYLGDDRAHHIYLRRSEPTVVFGSRDSGVANRAREGRTFLDGVWSAAPFATHAAFLERVSSLSAEWVRLGLFSAAEQTAILAAAQAAEPDLRA